MKRLIAAASVIGVLGLIPATAQADTSGVTALAPASGAVLQAG